MTTEERLRTALERIASSEIPGVSGGPNGPSAQVMEFAAKALDEALGRPPCDVCARYQRGDAADRDIQGIRIHECIMVPYGWIGESCPCGCDLSRIRFSGA